MFKEGERCVDVGIGADINIDTDVEVSDADIAIDFNVVSMSIGMSILTRISTSLPLLRFCLIFIWFTFHLRFFLLDFAEPIFQRPH